MGAGKLEESIAKQRRRLFSTLYREIGDEKVLRAMEEIPRELFVPEDSHRAAYDDVPLPIGGGQTISQPFIVAMMTSALELMGNEKVLEIGTGSGYQTALLSSLVPQGRVLTLERVPGLARAAESRLKTLGYHNVEVRTAGEVLGCPEEGPFDAVIVTAAAPRLPKPLLDQMAPWARMVIPIGTLEEQELVMVLKTSEGPTVRMLGACRFVPLIGPDAWPEKR